ncbi:hypothetical protein RBU55_30250 [Pseudomonas chlororaphis subsp. aurantiaca]|uniref:ApeA N-terminal domain 1-containing protein n=1 Tax=Pseudomonas chlororaphis TaxID=587753 RepID=UPI0027DE033F|nr:HEPN domain-containing protein [Pseudomonas chlororaphis]WMI99764.1 hypothetical protein RBU55_30250 [Pseudomonas chlororaphis subsp. aurantiaca]
MDSTATHKKMAGEFWTPEKPDTKISGYLSINNDGSFSIETEKAFSRDDCVIENAVYGILENKKKISMHNPMYLSKTYGIGNIPPSKLSSPILYLGDFYLENKENLKGTSLKFVVQGLQSWFEDDNQPLKINIQEKTTLQYSGFDIVFCHESNDQNGTNNSISTITSSTPVSLEEFQTILHRAITFLSFATGRILLQEKTQIVNQDGVMDIYYRPAFFTDKKQSIVTPLFKNGHANLQSRFNVWNKIYDDILPLIILYFLPKINELDITTKYILSAQLIEALHRKLEHKNELDYYFRVRSIVLRSKYTKLLFPPQSEESINKLCRNITDARNHFTHYIRKAPPEAASASNLPFLTLKLQLIIDLYILDKIGFDKKYFQTINDTIIADRFFRQKDVSRFLTRG